MNNQDYFIGIVEDNLDPDNMGRVRVRCYGIHSESKVELPTNHLSWFITGCSTNSSSSDIATVEIGTCVKGIFLDGIDMQVGLVEVIIPGLHTFTDISKGFSNLKPNPPKQGTVTGNPYSRAKGYPERVPYADFTSARGKSISEPKGTRKPRYPFNIATMSDSGHVIERDDTPNNERLSFQDKNGSYIEKHKGNIVIKAIKDLYNLCNNYYKGIVGERVISVGKGDYLKVVSGDKIIEIDNGQLYLTVTGDVKIITSANTLIESIGNCEINSGGSMEINANGQLNLTGAAVTINGSVINLN